MFYLLDLERTIRHDRPYFWKSNSRGYTSDINQAGTYSEKIALEIVDSDFDKRTIMIPSKTIDKLIKSIYDY